MTTLTKTTLTDWNEIAEWYAVAGESAEAVLAAAIAEYDGNLQAAWKSLIDDLEAGAGDATYSGETPDPASIRRSLREWASRAQKEASIRLASSVGSFLDHESRIRRVEAAADIIF